MSSTNLKDLKDKFSDDTEFQNIHKNFIKLNTQEQKENTEDVLSVINTIFNKMKKHPDNSLIMERIAYAGSFFKGTKVGEPDEYDFDFVIKLPYNYEKDLTISDIDSNGFLTITIKNNYFPVAAERLKKEISDNGKINCEKFRAYLKSIFYKSVSYEKYFILVAENGKRYEVELKNVFTAFTLVITTPNKKKIDVDFVPALGMDNKKLSITSDLNKDQWLIVAKPSVDHSPGYWSAFLLEQEKDLLKEGGLLKPIIRMLKKLRDTQDLKSIKSYYIEVLILNELKNSNVISEIMKWSKTAIFVYMLKRMLDCIRQKKLPDYWIDGKNLFEEIESRKLNEYEGILSKMLKDIEQNYNSKNILGKYIY